MTNPYGDDSLGSVLESTAVLSNLLRREGYSRDDISDIAVGQFLNNERNNISSPSSLHLMSLKKILLYAIPVIAPRGSNTGIALTSQVSTQAIQYDVKHNKSKECALFINDKFRLIGFSFPNRLINHLSMDIFQWKFFTKIPLYYTPPAIDLSELNGFETKKHLYLIKPSHYEDVNLFNDINRYIAFALNPDLSPVLGSFKPMVCQKSLPIIKRIEPFNHEKFIKQLNEVLPRQIDATYTTSLYESLHMTMNAKLYDDIQLFGFDSPSVQKYLNNLAYVKSQNLKVRSNLREVQHQLLLDTRAEKIARDLYPQFFDFTDRRAIFSKFNRFMIDKLPKDAKNNVRILLDKAIAYQNALLINKCEHIAHLKQLQISRSTEEFHKFEQYINYDSVDENNMYSCLLCSYPILCVHEVELYESMASIDPSNSTNDEYWVQQKIINKYKAVNQKRTGDEDTESAFTFYCKHCGGYLGQSEDIIQSSIKTINESSVVVESNPIQSSIYLYLSTIVSIHMNQSIIPMSKKAITKLIYEEISDEIIRYVNRASKNEQDNIDTMIKYLCTIYGLAALISLNINKIKSSESILINSSNKENQQRNAEPIVGGAELKHELILALKIVQNITVFKKIGVTDDKIKSTLIEAFKYINKTFANEGIVLKARSPKELLLFDIQSSPVSTYALFMAKRFRKQHDMIEAVGVNLDSLFPKTKKAEQISTHALYTNIFVPKKKDYTGIERYIIESYQSIADCVVQEPTNKKYISIITPPTSNFIKEFETKRREKLQLNRDNPERFLPVENSREYNFTLKTFQLGYCLNNDGTTRPHRWFVTKKGSNLEFTCRFCSLNIKNADKKNNEKIDHALSEQMNIEAFFELYTLACPVKDAHIFESDECIQCKASKNQIKDKDPKYYKKYSAIYSKFKQSITSELLISANRIGLSITPLMRQKDTDKVIKPDFVALESLASSLSKLYGHSNLKDIGMDSTNKRSLEIIESYVRMLYSHYIFVKNLSVDVKGHPDAQFFSFVKASFYDGIKVKPLNLQPLPEYPTSTNADQLTFELFKIMYDLISKSQADTNILIKFILNKMVAQDSRRKEFNFAKLKAVATNDDEEQMVIENNNEEDDEEMDIFNGYDIDEEDKEDNIHGDIE